MYFQFLFCIENFIWSMFFARYYIFFFGLLIFFLKKNLIRFNENCEYVYFPKYHLFLSKIKKVTGKNF